MEETLTMCPWALQARIARTAAWPPTRSASTFVSSMAQPLFGIAVDDQRGI
jgi:hypothetical protein